MKEKFLLDEELQWEMEYVFGNGAIWAFIEIDFLLGMTRMFVWDGALN